MLVLGHDRRADTLVLHNPSGHTAESQTCAEVPGAVFEAHFAHRGMVLAARDASARVDTPGIRSS